MAAFSEFSFIIQYKYISIFYKQKSSTFWGKKKIRNEQKVFWIKEKNIDSKKSKFNIDYQKYI